jgi:predicted nucleotidyltransferase
MVVLYGSFSRGTQHEGSDIDVAVVVDEIQGDLIDRETELYRIRRGIDDRIEPVLVQRNPDPSGFVEHILANGEVIYPD